MQVGTRRHLSQQLKGFSKYLFFALLYWRGILNIIKRLEKWFNKASGSFLTLKTRFRHLSATVIFAAKLLFARSPRIETLQPVRSFKDVRIWISKNLYKTNAFV